MKKRKKYRTAKDFIDLWAQKYRRVVGIAYIPNYEKEGLLWKRLQDHLKDREIIDLINFTFSDTPVLSYLRESGYPIDLFMSRINQIQFAFKKPEFLIPDKELELDTPYWNDIRISFLWSLIEDNDLKRILNNVTKEYTWTLLFAKMKRQNVKIPIKALKFFKIWKESKGIS